MEVVRLHTQFEYENLKRKKLLVDLGREERIILNQKLKKQNMAAWL
jgi:hypothetical protein